MSLGTVASLKGSAQAYTPLLLAVVTFQGTSTQLLLSTHPINTTEGGPTFPGIGTLPAGGYLGRLSQQDIAALQQRSNLGIDRFSSVKIHISDADHYIWTNFCQAYGFRGATLQLCLVMWQVGTSNFSTDAPIQFNGTCDMELPANGMTVITVSANSGHNTATVQLPMFPIQSRCPLTFPANAAQRAASLAPNSQLCIYSADQSGGVGNQQTTHANPYTDPNTGVVLTDSAGNYIVCDFVRSNSTDAYSGCMPRLGNPATTSVAPDGDLEHDIAGHHTGGFAGIEWSPGTYYALRTSYTQGQVATFSYLNASILGQYQNLLYGMQWVDGKIANIIETGNDTKCEVMLCTGNVVNVYGASSVSMVVFNGISLYEFPQANPHLGWRFTNSGGRFGSMQTDTGYTDNTHSALGDPYGQIACIETVVFTSIFNGFGIPSCRVLLIGPQIPVYTSQTAFTLTSAPENSNPAWVLLDILVKANWSVPEIDISTFIAAAAFCDQDISYLTQSGQTSMHARYICQFVLEQRITAARLIASILRSFNGYLATGQNGLLQLFINQTLADSQPAPITGSNYNTSVPSIHYDNSTGTGYVAFSFDETTIATVGQDAEKHFDIEWLENATVQTPNQVFISFQDMDNGFVSDSLSEIDPQAVTRAGDAALNGAVVPTTLDVTGISNFDQAVRIANVYIAERQRGNEADDPRGTRVARIGSTVVGEHLRSGHLVFLTLPTIGLTQQIFRIIGIEPATNFKTAHYTMSWVNEVWYTDVYGQAPQAFYSETNRNLPQRQPLPWQPNAEGPNSTVYSATEYNFAISETQTTLADGTLISFNITGAPPVSNVSTLCTPPRVPLQANVLTSGGSNIPVGYTIVMQICAIDSNGGYSAPSQIITAYVPSGSGSTVSLEIVGVNYQPGTNQWALFAGTNAFNITKQLIGTSGYLPSTITLANWYNTLAFGPPDLRAATINMMAKHVIHTGLYAMEVASMTSTTITLSTATGGGPLTNNLAGYTCVFLGRSGFSGNFPIVDFHISSNSGYVLTVTNPPSGNPTTLLNPADLVTIPYQANIASATTIGDANAVNVYTPTGFTAADVGNIVMIIFGTARHEENTIVSVSSDGKTLTMAQAWSVIPDSTSGFIVVEPSWRYSSVTSDGATLPYANVANAAAINVSNYNGLPILLKAQIGDASTPQNLSNLQYSPWRMQYVYGVPGSGGGNPGYWPLTIVSNAVAIDLVHGEDQYLVINQATQVVIDNPVSTGVAIAPDSVTGFFTLYLVQDATGGRPAPNFAASGTNFGPELANLQIGPSPNSVSTLALQYHMLPTDPGPLWHIYSYEQGS